MKLNNLSNLAQRIIAALVAIPIVLFCILYNEWTFGLLFLAISILTQLEFYKLLGLDGNLPLEIWGTFCGATLNILTFLVEKDVLEFKYYYIIIPLLTITFFIKLFKPNDKRPFANLGYTFLGVIYVAVPFSLIYEMVITDNSYKPELILGTLFILWVNDSGAYFAGRFLGKRKLFERVSPKKTWEGFWGGAIFATVMALILQHFYSSLAAWQWISIACIIFTTGTLGDLVESLFKRSIAIKDSGSIIPGHGGFLDRFDGLLLSMPFILSFLKIFG